MTVGSRGLEPSTLLAVTETVREPTFRTDLRRGNPPGAPIRTFPKVIQGKYTDCSDAHDESYLVQAEIEKVNLPAPIMHDQRSLELGAQDDLPAPFLNHKAR